MDKQNTEIFFQLLRHALGKGEAFSLPEQMDWNALVQQAMEHGLDAIAFDGLQAVYDQVSREEAAALDASLGELKFDWLGFTLQAEQVFERQWRSFVGLGKIFREEGLRMLVLKGFSLNECYPVPSHRSSCDIDCFLMDDGPMLKREAYVRGNQVMEARGIPVERDYFKHSSFKFKGTQVENHQFCTSWRNSARSREFELLLLSLLEHAGELRHVEGSEALVGPTLFNALFLTCHAQVHFMIEDGISLRHICDWGMFLKRYGSELDWDEFMGHCRRFGMDRFAESMTRLAAYVCGIAVGPLVSEIGDRVALNDDDRCLLEDTLAIGQKKKNQLGRLGHALVYLRSAWKFRLFSDRSALSWFWGYTRGFFFNRTPKLDS